MNIKPGRNCLALSDEERAQIARLYTLDNKVEEIAALYGIDRITVRNAARKAGVPARPSGRRRNGNRSLAAV